MTRRTATGRSSMYVLGVAHRWTGDVKGAELCDRCWRVTANGVILGSDAVFEAALRRLVHELVGVLGIIEPQMRHAAGNTNINILIQRLAEARALLAVVRASHKATVLE